MKDTELAWAAGIIDGEGCITVTKQRAGTGGRVNPTHRLYVKVAMGHRPTVEHLRDIFNNGTIIRQPGGKWNDAFVWWVAQRQAGRVLALVQPYLLTKAHEAELAQEFLAIPRVPQGGRLLPPETVAERERLFAALRDAKPSARFRKAS